MKPDSETEAACEIRRITVTAILADPSIQQRECGTSTQVVGEYAEAMREGVKFPPIVVFSNDGVHYHLGDGFHRLGASRLVQYEEINVVAPDGRRTVQRGVELDSAGSRGIHQGGRTARPRSRYS